MCMCLFIVFVCVHIIDIIFIAFFQYLEWPEPATTLDNLTATSVTYKSSGLYQLGCSLIGTSSVTMVSSKIIHNRERETENVFQFV